MFDFSFLQVANLFYSRRIGLYAGNAVRIYGGARMTGRIGKLDLGFLDMQTEKFKDNPSENFGVLRLKRNVFNQNSFIGGILTSRLGMDGTYNIAYGLDGQFRVKGNDYLILRMAQSFEDEAENKILELTPARLLFQWQRRNQVGLGYDIQYAYSGEDYNPGVGFERKKSYHGPNATANVRFRFNPREGNDFWVEYDEGLNTNLQRVTPELPLSTGRTILLKYTFTFRL